MEVGLLKLNHINLAVSDVVVAADFLEKYFGMVRVGGDEKFTAMFDSDHLVLSLMKHGPAVKYPGSFHIGFGQPDHESVNRIFQQLKDDGFDVNPPEQHHAWTFYVQAPGGFTVEVMA